MEDARDGAGGARRPPRWRARWGWTATLPAAALPVAALLTAGAGCAVRSQHEVDWGRRPGGADAPPLRQVTPAQFAELRWLEGTWRGRAAGGAPFYERYHVVDDSTIQMTGYPDSTLAAPRAGDRVVLRGGVVRYENVVATRLDRAGVTFAAPSGRFGFAWERAGRGWTATLRSTDTSGRARTVVYQMEPYRAPGSTPNAAPGTGARAGTLDRAPLERLAAAMRGGTYGNVDHLLVVRDDAVLVDERFPRDYAAVSRGRRSALGCGADACPDSAALHPYNYLHPRFHPWWQGRDVHTLQSVTKSVAATLVGVAQQRGEIAGPGVPLLSFFGAYDLRAVDPRLRRATLADLLTMRSGIAWHEADRPLDSTNTTLQLERSPDWIRFTLAQPADAEPGAKWAYNSGGSQLVAEVIRSATGEHADRYAARHLFGPLGIRDYHWKRTPTGHPDTEGGLYLNARDLAKVGRLYLDDGVWGGRRLLPPGWAREATARHVERVSDAPNAPGYGYQWWRYDRRGAEVWAGNGFGGQFLVVIPAHRLVGVVNAWNVFGDRVPGVLGPLIAAMLDAAGAPGQP